MADTHDSKRGVHPLPALKPGTTIILQDGCMDATKRWSTGTVLATITVVGRQTHSTQESTTPERVEATISNRTPSIIGQVFYMSVRR